MADDEIGPINLAFRIIVLFAVLIGFVYGAWLLGTVAFVIALVLLFLLALTVFISITDTPGKKGQATSKGVDNAMEQVSPQLREQLLQIRAQHKEHAKSLASIMEKDFENRTFRAEQAREEQYERAHVIDFCDEVWGKLWDKYGSSSFTTDDVVGLGNTDKDANDVLVYLKHQGVLNNVGLREFELSRGPLGHDE